jgi:abortive infection bacteriophage resistance protein
MSKQATTYSEQLDVLVSRGLVIENRAFAEHCLAHHNYYRLSAYRFSFIENGNPDCFIPGTRFEQLWNLYHFDRGLRQLLLEATKRIEISVRSRLAYEVGHRLGPLAYLENKHFRDPLIHAKTLVKLDSEMSRSKEKFIGHHKNVLHMKWPPIWVLVEVASFGAVSNLLSQIESPQIRQAVADSYKMDEKTFCSLFHHLSVVRNTAAHHSRLWNRKFVVTFQLPRKKPADLWPNFNQTKINGNGKDRHIYNTLVLLVHFIRCIEPQSCWSKRLLTHLSSLEPALIQEMGFPTEWKELPIWEVN